jgi:hypothetical protein
MKLKCFKHKRRVVVFSNGDMIHRTGDGSKCSGYHATGIAAFIPDTNGQRYAVTEAFPATFIIPETECCLHCEYERPALERYVGSRLSEIYLTCLKRQGNQPHVFI